MSKIIAEIPAMFVSRSIGGLQSSLHDSVTGDDDIDDIEDLEGLVDTPDNEGDFVTAEMVHNQQELIEQIEKNSKLKLEHWSNVVQQQVDGGLVGVPWLDEKGLRIEFKARDVYYSKDDGMGADLVYEIEIDEKEYLQVYRERVEGDDLHVRHILYELNHSRETKEVEESLTKKLLGINQLKKVYKGRIRPFILYWANEKTFMNPLGKSCLHNQEGKQDDINWTLTRNALTFERNGKPRIAVTPEIMRALQEKAYERYGDESKIDHRDLEITTLDEKGNAIEVIQIDVTKIGDVSWVKDLMKLMLMETKTSEKAVDFYLDNSGSSDQSGISKFYDLFTSLIKSKQIQQEYIYFIQELVESALWLANKQDNSIVVEEPEILLKSMIPISRKEMIEENTIAFEGANGKSTQSLETTVRRNNPNASEEWIQEELERIEAEQSSDDSFSLMQGRQTLQGMMGYRDEEGNIDDGEENEEGEE